jgi:hypothetical protein
MIQCLRLTKARRRHWQAATGPKLFPEQTTLQRRSQKQQTSLTIATIQKSHSSQLRISLARWRGTRNVELQECTATVPVREGRGPGVRPSWRPSMTSSTSFKSAPTSSPIGSGNSSSRCGASAGSPLSSSKRSTRSSPRCPISKRRARHDHLRHNQGPRWPLVRFVWPRTLPVARRPSAQSQVIVTGSRTPELDACRILIARGLTGKLAIFDATTKKLRVTIDIEAGAGMTVLENRKYGPRFAKCKPFERGAAR